MLNFDATITIAHIQGKRGRHVEENLRVSSVAVFPGLATAARSLTRRAIGVAGPVVTRGAARFLAEHAIELPLAGEAAGCGD
jgi:predicted nuclease with RNAse H fold